jgi:hypothetical protein
MAIVGFTYPLRWGSALIAEIDGLAFVTGAGVESVAVLDLETGDWTPAPPEIGGLITEWLDGLAETDTDPVSRSTARRLSEAQRDTVTPEIDYARETARAA